MKIEQTTDKPFFISWWMTFFNYDGLATPWNIIYYRDAVYMSDKKLRKHELKHIEQMERDGIPKYLIMYTWYWVTIGYENNPYEIEAREAAQND